MTDLQTDPTVIDLRMAESDLQAGVVTAGSRGGRTALGLRGVRQSAESRHGDVARGARLVLEADEIRQLLPHRWPMILLDRVTELCPGISGTGLKNVTANEPYFPGHFPAKAVMPGVMVIEALAQLGGLVASFPDGPDDPEPTPSERGYLAGVRRLRFRRLIRPGDQIRLTVHREAAGQGVVDFRAEARVEGQVVVSGNVLLAI